MWFKHLTFFSLTIVSVCSHAIAYKLPGDQLAAGQQFIASSFALSDWYSSASYVGNAESEAIDDTVRGFSRAHHKGYGFSSELVYMLGITSNMTLGFRTGYAFDKGQTKVDDSVGDQVEGELVSEGGTDLTVLGYFKRDEHSTWDIELDLPICSAKSVQEVCSSRPAAPNNDEQAGVVGGQGNGFYGLKLGLSSNWLSQSDVHWLGRASVKAYFADEVYGQKVAAPLTFSAQFGFILPIELRHEWSMTLAVQKMLGYSGYSEALQTQVDFGEQSALLLKGEYFWSVLNQVQLKPFAQLAFRELADERFVENGRQRRLEYTGGTVFTMGAQLSAAF